MTYKIGEVHAALSEGMPPHRHVACPPHPTPLTATCQVHAALAEYTSMATQRVHISQKGQQTLDAKLRAAAAAAVDTPSVGVSRRLLKVREEWSTGPVWAIHFVSVGGMQVQISPSHLLLSRLLSPSVTYSLTFSHAFPHLLWRLCVRM